jgi:hypothetical protein
VFRRTILLSQLLTLALCAPMSALALDPELVYQNADAARQPYQRELPGYPKRPAPTPAPPPPSTMIQPSGVSSTSGHPTHPHTISGTGTSEVAIDCEETAPVKPTKAQKKPKKTLPCPEAAKGLPCPPSTPTQTKPTEPPSPKPIELAPTITPEPQRLTPPEHQKPTQPEPAPTPRTIAQPSQEPAPDPAPLPTSTRPIHETPAHLFIALLAALGIIMLIALIARSRRVVAATPEEQDPEQLEEQESSHALVTPPKEHEVLASQGRFAEAIHALQLMGLRMVIGQHASLKKPSRTPRQIVRMSELPAERRAALQELVEASERHTFAKRPASEQDYLRCVQLAQLVTQPEATSQP